MAPEHRNSEIWSTRVQKELLALTTDEKTADEISLTLPPFCTVKEHHLDIEHGNCTVDFEALVDIPNDLGNKMQVKVVLQLDVSMNKKKRDRKVIDESTPTYPFQEPKALLKAGAEHFPGGSTVKNGDRVDIDLDWTPSLHMTDAILPLALKIKECILQGEPFHPAKPKHVKRSFKPNFSGMGKASLTKAFSPSKLRGSPKVKATPDNLRIGDEINLLQEPWVDAHGVYSCKAIRRPEFIAKTMEAGEAHQQEVALSSPTSMFRSFAQSARGVLEESFIMITETHIIELKASKLNMTTGRIAMALPVDMLAKLKFRREESLSLYFKSAPEDPLVYMCPDSGDAVHQIQSVLKRYGVKGKHTNAAAHRVINEALQLVQEIQTKELALKHDPTVERVNDIMDLYRQAAELFEIAGDMRHAEVVTHMRKFLALPLTMSILDGTFQRPPEQVKSPAGTVPVGEVLDRPDSLVLDDDDRETDSQKEKENDKQFEENIDKLLQEAQKTKAELNLERVESSDSQDRDPALTEMAADLDALMKKADEELAELMRV